MKRKQIELNEWTFIFSITRDHWRHHVGWYVFEFGVFKAISRPPEGCRYARSDYKGIWIRFLFFLPFGWD